MIPKNRESTSLGKILIEEFLYPLKMTEITLAKKMNVRIQVVNDLVADKYVVYRRIALKLSGVFGNSSEFWMNLYKNKELRKDD